MSSVDEEVVSVYFVASPLQYLAAQQIAKTHDRTVRQLLFWYQPGVSAVVNQQDWDIAEYLPWPRHQPLPGLFGRHRRLLANVRRVAELVGHADLLYLHSAVFDTEAINYFLHALPQLSGCRRWHARILPDGIINVRRYPLSPVKKLLMRLRSIRALATPLLSYTPFSGDRIGSDAGFCDRIYVLPGIPHEYPQNKVATLDPLAAPAKKLKKSPTTNAKRRALLIGQPLVGAGLINEQAAIKLQARLRDWLLAQGIQQVVYKGHPKDLHQELRILSDEVVQLDQPLELWMTEEVFDAVVGARSSALLFARQIYPSHIPVASFGWDLLKFKSVNERSAMRHAFESVGVLIDPTATIS